MVPALALRALARCQRAALTVNRTLRGCGFGMKSSAFPYYGNNPASDAPFLNIASGDRKGHRSYSGRVYWQDQTYNDNRVLMTAPRSRR